MGTFKGDTIKSHSHNVGGTGRNSNVGGSTGIFAGSAADAVSSAVGTAETAPKHTAYAPRLHA